MELADAFELNNQTGSGLTFNYIVHAPEANSVNTRTLAYGRIFFEQDISTLLCAPNIFQGYCCC